MYAFGALMSKPFYFLFYQTSPVLAMATNNTIDISFISLCRQKAVLDIYQEEQAKVPGYIKNLDAVLREYYPTLVSKEREVMESFTTDKYEQTYNAFENDIAVLNVYFGQPTTTEYIRLNNNNNVRFI